MTARNKYLVIHPVGSPTKQREVYADEISMSPTGDMLFKQVRPSALVNDKGERNMETDMVPVLIMRAGTFDAIQLMPTSGENPCYLETGAITLAH